MREVDDHWPAPGARLHHSVGTWPLTLDDITEVVESVPGARLELQAHAWPAGRRRRDDHAAPPGRRDRGGDRGAGRSRGPAPLMPKVVQDPLLDWRNVESLRRLAFLAERRQQQVA